ncbi:MAG: FxsA family protein [Beijerinckiaceae bacterium]|nr:FxsA family protein [Beijerinckiaceae bacterium]MCI0735246.1 FxsA family protein [Beijerinckiaceae bacterium]
MLRLRYLGTYVRQPLVRWPVLIGVYFALWLGAELAAFGAVVHAIGFTGAIVACVLTSLAGVAMLRRIGVSAAARLRQALARKASEHNGLSRDALVDGTLAGLGAVLLILPGFVSDLAGLALAAPSFRLWVSDKLNLGRNGKPGSRAAPDMIELAPREWSRLDGPAPDL